MCSLRGTVAVVEDDGQSTRLYFDPQDRSVRVLLMHGWLVTWPSYDGQTIVATGKVDRFRDHVEMILLASEQHRGVGGRQRATAVRARRRPQRPLSPSPTATVSLPSPTPSIVARHACAAVCPRPTRDEVEQLRERVRELEERVRELEGGER